MWTKWIIVTTEGRAAWDQTRFLTVRINDWHLLDGSNYN